MTSIWWINAYGGTEFVHTVREALYLVIEDDMERDKKSKLPPRKTNRDSVRSA